MLERRKGSESPNLGWLLASRLLLALFSIALIAITSAEPLKRSSYYPAYTLLIIVCCANLIYLIFYRWRGGSLLFATIQIGIDIFFVTTLMLLSGASRSSFSFLYYAVLLAAATLISKRSAIFFASLATVLLSGVTVSYYLAYQYDAAIPLVSSDWIEMAKQNLNSMLGYLVAQGLALHIVGFLAGQLAIRAADIRALYGRILDNMTQGILVIGHGNRVLYANREAARLLGITFSAQLAQSNVEDVLPAEIKSKIRQVLDPKKKAPGEIHFEISDNNARAKHMDVNTSLLRDSRDRRVGTIILLSDLTLRHRLEESQKRIARLQEIEEMSAGLAHEIRNPLASIRGCTQELGKYAFEDKTNNKLAEIVCRESDRLDKIVNDFLNLAKIKPPVFSRTDLDNLLEEVVILLRSREDARDIQIFNEVSEKMRLYCDPEQLRQVLLNLGINSLEALNGHGFIRFSAKRVNAGQSPKISKGLLDPDFEGYVIEVKDNGYGIKKEILQKVFTPFFTTKQAGTGMGLAIANKIIADHRGLLEIDSEPGKNTITRVWLPLYPRSALRRDKI
jgi:two-component system sensor histidine kinase PilS (NtrC family)